MHYLVKLMEDGEFQRCLEVSDHLLLKGGLSLAEMATVNMVICRCRVGLQDPFSAVPSGLLAVKLARDTGEWDTLGRTFLNLGTAYVGTRQYDQALHHFYSYFEYYPRYGAARRFEGAIWKNIGIAHQRRLEHRLAIDAITRARCWFRQREIDHSAFTCTHDLINIYLQMYEMDPTVSLDPVAELLKEARTLSQKYPNNTYYRATYLCDRAAYYQHQGRLGRAMICAMQAMELREDDHELEFHCHMTLHTCTKRLGDPQQALGYALAARMAALQAQHFELELLAFQAVNDVIRQQGEEVVQQLAEQYQSIGIDLSQYLPPTVLKRGS